MQQRSFLALGASGFHRVGYTEWGDPASPRVVVCVHGLTRNGRDFDFLAAALARQGWRVVCPDVPGRGESDWLSDPRHYEVPVYCSVLTNLIARLDVEQLDWIGTSMGGIIGMALAAQQNSPIRRLVLNDVGAFIPKEALGRIRGYVGVETEFPSLDAVEAHLRSTLAGFGPLSELHWRHLAEHSARRDADGVWRMRYDPRIGDIMREAPLEDGVLWTLWDNLPGPVLVVRGEQSDVLPAEVVHAMRQRGPGCQVVEFPGHGHAPPIMDEREIAAVAAWLNHPGR